MPRPKHDSCQCIFILSSASISLQSKQQATEWKFLFNSIKESEVNLGIIQCTISFLYLQTINSNIKLERIHNPHICQTYMEECWQMWIWKRIAGIIPTKACQNCNSKHPPKYFLLSCIFWCHPYTYIYLQSLWPHSCSLPSLHKRRRTPKPWGWNMNKKRERKRNRKKPSNGNDPIKEGGI